MINDPEILLIDDEELFRGQLKRAFEKLQSRVLAFSDLASAQAELPAGFNPFLIFADRKIRGEFIENKLLAQIKQKFPNSQVVIYTRKDELSQGQISSLLTAGAVRVLDRSEVANSPKKILDEFKELCELAKALDDLTRGRSELVTALVGTDVGVTMIDRQFVCWFANKRQEDLVCGRCKGGLCWQLFHDQPLELGPCWGCGIQDVLNQPLGGESTIHRTILTHLRNGSVRWLLVQAKPVQNAGNRIIAGTEAVSALSDKYVSSMGTTERLFGVSRGLLHAGFGRARIYRTQPVTGTMSLLAAASRKDGFEENHYFNSVEHLVLDYNKDHFASLAIESRTGILVDDKMWAKHGPARFAAALMLKPPYFLIPIWLNEKNHELIAFLAVDFVDWDDEHKQAAIDHLALCDNLRWLREGYGNEIRKALSGGQSDYDGFSQNAYLKQSIALQARTQVNAASSVAEAVEALKNGFAQIAPNCVFSIRRRKGNSLIAEHRLDVPSKQDNVAIVELGDSKSLASYVATTYGRPIWIDRYREHREGKSGLPWPVGLSREDTESTAHLPLRIETTIYGVLSIDSTVSLVWHHEGLRDALMELADCGAMVLREIAIQDDLREAQKNAEDASRKLVAMTYEAEKRENWRRVSYEIAHQMKNPIAAQAQFLLSLRQKMQANPLPLERLLKLVASVSRTNSRMEKLISRIMELANNPNVDLKPCKLSGFLSTAWETVKVGMAPDTHIDFILQVPAELRVLADQSLLHSSLDALLGNAIMHGALKSVGIKKIICNCTGPYPRGTGLCPEMEGDYVCILLEDSGPGLPPAIAQKLAEPFKAEAQGLGLGLAIACERIRDMGGMLKIIKNAEHDLTGAAFAIALKSYNGD